MQTSNLDCTSTRQVLNRLRAFSGSGPGHAFTVPMVQQAIDDCLAAQGTSCLLSSGAVTTFFCYRPSHLKFSCLQSDLSTLLLGVPIMQ